MSETLGRATGVPDDGFGTFKPDLETAGLYVPRITDPAEAEKLAPGAEFMTPDGKTRVRPYDVTDDASYREVPMGSYYREGGNTRQKPNADGGVNMLAQTLYDMAHTDEGRKEALAFIYGSDAVSNDRGEFYVTTADGKRLSPSARTLGGMLKRAGGAVGAGALPAIGGAAGSLAGIPAAAGGPGAAIAGGMAGAAAGSALGEAGNQEILKRMGIEDLPTGERVKEAALAGGIGAAGTGVATAIPAVPAAARAIGERIGNALPRAAAKFVGAEPEATGLAREIAREGGRTPLSSYAPEAPFVDFIMKWAKQFGYDPVGKAARETWYPGMSSELLGRLGVPEGERDLIGKTAAVSLEPAGSAARDRVRADLQARTADLTRAVEGHRTYRTTAATEAARGEARDIATEQTALVTAADKTREAAQRAIDQGISDVRREVGDALAAAEVEPGVISRQFANVISNGRRALGKQANALYSAADELAGDAAPNVAPLTQWASGIVDEVPAALRAEYPREYETIARLAGKTGEAPKQSGLLDQFGNPVQAAAPEAKPVTFGDLHQLRNFLRAKVDWGDLTRGPKEGSLVRLESELNNVINDADANPALKAAAVQLRSADDFYRDNIRKFEDETVRQIARFGRTATAPDVEKLADLTLKEGNRERIRMLREMGGEDIWNQVVAADTRSMMNEAGLRTGQIDAPKFAAQVMERLRSGVLAEAYPPEQARRLTEMATRISRLQGKVPIQAQPGDTLITMLDRADAQLERARVMASRDPMKMLSEEIKGIDKEAKAALAEGQKGIAQNPLAPIGSPTIGAQAAAEKILSSPDMIAEAERQFGANSPEFTMLRQTYARRLVQDIADATIPAPGRTPGGLGRVSREFADLPEDTQQRLFPGVTRDQMSGFIRKMVLMFAEGGEDFGASLSGASLVTHPQQGARTLFGSAGRVLSVLPAAGARFVVSKALDVASRAATSPKLVEFIARGLEGSGAEKTAAQEALRAIVDGTAARGAVGAAAGTYGGRQAGAVDAEPPPAPPQSAPNWRQRIQAPPAGGWRSRIPGHAEMAPASGAAAQLAAAGRHGDTELVHANPREVAMLEEQGGAGTVNPVTGLREFYEGGADFAGGRGGGTALGGTDTGLGSPAAAEAAGMAGAAMGGGISGSLGGLAGTMGSAMGGAGLGATNAAQGLGDAVNGGAAATSPDFLSRQIGKITPGGIFGSVLTGAIGGPIGLGLSAASTISGLLGGPTIGGTINSILGKSDGLGPAGDLAGLSEQERRLLLEAR